MNPKYYRTLDCDSQQSINDQILAHISQLGLENTTDFWNPINILDFVKANSLLVSFLRNHNLVLRDVAVTVGTHSGCCLLHTDTPPAKIKLNWPVKNTQHTFTRWFKPLTDNPSVTVNRLGGICYNDYSQLIEVERVELTKPCLIDATVPHDVLITDQAVLPRIGLQCMFFKEPQKLYE